MTLKKTDRVYFISRAIDDQLRIYLNQGLFQEAIVLLENKISSEGIENNILYLRQQAEIYLLVDTKKALTTIELVNLEVPPDHFIKPSIEKLAEAFRLITSDNPVQGYQLLFEEDLLISDKVFTNLHEKLVIEYPGEF